MLNTIFGKKLGMTQVFSEKGEVIPVTVIQAGPCVVVQKKTQPKDGYNALQLGYGEKKEKLLNKPLKNHLKKANISSVRYLREVRLSGPDEYKTGDKIEINVFKAGDYVDVKGTSRGKGMAGVMKRHNFKGGPMSHGCTNKRGPGGLSASSYPSRVFKGTKMAGRMGNDIVKVLKLEVIDIREKENLMLVKGAVPGGKNSFLVISKTNRFVKPKVEVKVVVKATKKQIKRGKK